VGSKASIEADVILYGVTAGRAIDSRRFLDASSPSPVQVAFYDIPEGDQDVNITTSVTRGRTYEIRLRAKAAAKSGVGALTEVTFGGNFGGDVELQRVDEAQGGAIALTLGQDPFEQILEMQDQLAALAEQYAELRAEFDGHTRVYLTGRGVGHNDLEASTTAPIVGEGTPPEIEESPGAGLDPEAATVIPVQGLRLDSPVPRRSGSIAIRYSVRYIGTGAPVSVVVYDVTGREVRTLGNEFLQPGDYTIDWDRRDTLGREVPAGVYLLKLQSGDRAATKKVVLMR